VNCALAPNPLRLRVCDIGLIVDRNRMDAIPIIIWPEGLLDCCLIEINM
jgi:hypothetical protein